MVDYATLFLSMELRSLCGVFNTNCLHVSMNKLQPEAEQETIQEFTTKLPVAFPKLFNREIGDFNGDIVDYMPFKSRPQMKFYKQRVMVGKAHEAVLKSVAEWKQLGIVKAVAYTPKVVLPIVVVAKPRSDKLRVCFDYRLLNASLEQLYAPPIDRHKLIHSLQQKQYLSQLDISNAFMSIRIAENIQDYFGFEYDSQFFVMQRLKEGYHNSMFLYLRAMHSTVAKIKPLLPPGAVLYCYVDDLAIGTDTLGAHLKALKVVCHFLELDGWALQATKCKLLQKSILFLGLHVGQNNVSLDHQTWDKLQALPIPECHQDLRGFFGLCVGLNAFFYKLEMVIAPLRAFKGQPANVFQTPQFLDAWASVLKQVTNSWWSVDYFDSTATTPLDVYLDSSKVGHGGALVQGTKLIQLYSTSNLKPWASSAHAELDGYCKVLKAFASFLFHRPFRVFTDNRAVMAAHVPGNHSDFVLRRIDDLQALRLFPSSVEHIEGSRNFLADILSRYSYFHGGHRKAVVQDNAPQVMAVTPPLTVSTDMWHELHFGHVGIKTILHRAQTWGVCITRGAAKQKILCCRVCQSCKDVKRSTLGKKWLLADRPNHCMSADFIGPIGTKPKRFILLVIDHFTRYILGAVTLNASGQDVINILSKWEAQFGIPQIFFTDKGGAFRSHLVLKWLEERHIKVVNAVSYDHRSNGMIERANRSVQQILRCLHQETKTDWQELLSDALFAYNSSVHSATGYTPDTLWSETTNVWEIVRHKAKEIDRIQTEKRQLALKNQPIYKKWDRVWAYKIREKDSGTLGRFSPRWYGPCWVLKRVSDSLYYVRLPVGFDLIMHSGFLKPYVSESNL